VTITGKLMDLPLKKSSVNVTIIDKTQIQNSAAQSVEEVLAYYTGWTLESVVQMVYKQIYQSEEVVLNSFTFGQRN
jgi:hypothetical protein